MKMPNRLLALLLAVGATLGFTRVAQADELLDGLKSIFGEHNLTVFELTGHKIVCGYSDVNSDQNWDMYADGVCRYFGLAYAVGSTCGASGSTDTFGAKVLTVDPDTQLPLEIPFVAESGRSLGFFGRIICLAKAPGEGFRSGKLDKF